jgi:hypothetical protein
MVLSRKEVTIYQLVGVCLHIHSNPKKDSNKITILVGVVISISVGVDMRYVNVDVYYLYMYIRVRVNGGKHIPNLHVFSLFKLL